MSSNTLACAELESWFTGAECSSGAMLVSIEQCEDTGLGLLVDRFPWMNRLFTSFDRTKEYTLLTVALRILQRLSHVGFDALYLKNIVLLVLHLEYGTIVVCRLDVGVQYNVDMADESEESERKTPGVPNGGPWSSFHSSITLSARGPGTPIRQSEPQLQSTIPPSQAQAKNALIEMKERFTELDLLIE